MSKRTRTRTQKRPAPISYRPPERLREEFRTLVHTSGLSINAFITAAVFGQAAPRSRRSAGVDKKLAARLLAKTAQLNDKLNDRLDKPFTEQFNDQAGVDSLGQGAHPGRPSDVLLQECRDELAEIRTCLLVALGREP